MLESPQTPKHKILEDGLKQFFIHYTKKFDDVIKEEKEREKRGPLDDFLTAWRGDKDKADKEEKDKGIFGGIKELTSHTKAMAGYNVNLIKLFAQVLGALDPIRAFFQNGFMMAIFDLLSLLVNLFVMPFAYLMFKFLFPYFAEQVPKMLDWFNKSMNWVDDLKKTWDEEGIKGVLKKAWKDVTEGLLRLFGRGLKTVASGLWDFIRSLFGRKGSGIGKMFSGLVQIGVALWGLWKVVKITILTFKAAWKVVNFFGKGFGLIFKLLNGVVGLVVKGLRGLITALWRFAGKIPGLQSLIVTGMTIIAIPIFAKAVLELIKIMNLFTAHLRGKFSLLVGRIIFEFKKGLSKISIWTPWGTKALAQDPGSSYRESKDFKTRSEEYAKNLIDAREFNELLSIEKAAEFYLGDINEFIKKHLGFDMLGSFKNISDKVHEGFNDLIDAGKDAKDEMDRLLDLNNQELDEVSTGIEEAGTVNHEDLQKIEETYKAGIQSIVYAVYDTNPSSNLACLENTFNKTVDEFMNKGMSESEAVSEVIKSWENLGINITELGNYEEGRWRGSDPMITMFQRLEDGYMKVIKTFGKTTGEAVENAMKLARQTEGGLPIRSSDIFQDWAKLLFKDEYDEYSPEYWDQFLGELTATNTELWNNADILEEIAELLEEINENTDGGGFTPIGNDLFLSGQDAIDKYGWEAPPSEQFHEGGIAMKPTRLNGIFGEAGAEALLPLARLPDLLGQYNSRFGTEPKEISMELTIIGKPDMDEYKEATKEAVSEFIDRIRVTV
jgi:hypothetical protein